MMSKFAIFFYVALLPSIIYCEDVKSIEACANDVVDIAKNGSLIEGVFQPLGDKPLGRGCFGFAYRGILLPIKMEIAMKFTRMENIAEAEKEYEMYSYLGAINDTNVERYGIPVVYYYGKWNANKLLMMGMSLLDRDVEGLATSKEIYVHEVNYLIIIRDFIMASKYMHSHAIRHNDVKLANMMTKKNRNFLIDFNVGSPMNERSYSGTPNYASRRGHSTGERYPKDDWESFLYSMCVSLGVQFPWLGVESMLDVFNFKQNTTATIELIEKINCVRLRDILVEFAKHVFDDGGEEDGFIPAKRYPDYNDWYKSIEEKIHQYGLPEPPTFTWLTDEKETEAIADLEKNPLPDITKIPEPINYNYETERKQVDFEKFTQGYKAWTESSTRSFVSASSGPLTAQAGSRSGSNGKKSKKSGSGSKGKKSGSKSKSGTLSFHSFSDCSIAPKKGEISWD